MEKSRRIMDLVKDKGDVYVFLADEETGARFMKDASAEGFAFGDGVSAAERDAGDIMCINKDHSICYVGYTGHMAFASGMKGGKPVDRIDYAKYLSGTEDYCFTK